MPVLKVWEVDVQVLVTKTIVFSGPMDRETAIENANRIIYSDFGGRSGIQVCQKWRTGTDGRPVPVEKVSDNMPIILEVREVAGE